jgi:hypothetical protein
LGTVGFTMAVMIALIVACIALAIAKFERIEF